MADDGDYPVGEQHPTQENGGDAEVKSLPTFTPPSERSRQGRRRNPDREQHEGASALSRLLAESPLRAKRTHPNSPHHPRMLASAARERYAWELRLRGWQWADIADELGYEGPSGAFRAYQRFARKLAQPETAQEMLTTQVARLAELRSRIDASVMDAKDAAALHLRILQEESKLLGLHAPARSQHQHDVNVRSASATGDHDIAKAHSARRLMEIVDGLRAERGLPTSAEMRAAAEAERDAQHADADAPDDADVIDGDVVEDEHEDEDAHNAPDDANVHDVPNAADAQDDQDDQDGT